MNTDTPKTDALDDKLEDISPNEKSDYWLMKLHARKLERELAVITAQRDRLAEALETITITGNAQYCREIANKALQSLTPKP